MRRRPSSVRFTDRGAGSILEGMRRQWARLAALSALCVGQGCGASEAGPSEPAAGSGAGATGGQSSSAGQSGSGDSRAGASGANAAGSGASGNGGATGGSAAVGGASSGGSAAGEEASGGAASGGAGGLDPNDPCAVPSYLASDPKPIGWASQGSGTTGGGDAEPILVTTLAQFKSEVSGSAAKVIYVQGDFAPDNISIGSNKTIIGCSPGARLRGHLAIGSGSSNLILRNLVVSGYGVGDCSKDPSFNPGEGCSSGADAISVNGSAHHVWFDHCSILDGTDGNLDITNDADFVTVSFTKFSYTPRTDDVGSDSTGAAGHRFSNLVGGTDTAPSGWPNTRPLNVTWHHNWWAEGVVERQPRVRYGQNHLFNNYYDSSASKYCVRAGIEASLLLEANYFDGVASPHQFNSASNQMTAHIALGAGDRENTYASTSGARETGGGGDGFTPPYAYEVAPASSVPAMVQANAGPH